MTSDATLSKKIDLEFLYELLPLRGLNITLEFTEESHLPLFQQSALTAYLRTLLGESPDYDLHLTLDLAQDSHTHYRKGEHYNFTLLALPGGEPMLQHLASALSKLPHANNKWDKAMPFKDNLRWHSSKNPFTNETFEHCGRIAALTVKDIESEVELWQQETHIGIRLLTPTRLLRRKEGKQKKQRNDEWRFCRDNHHLDNELWWHRLFDSLASLARRRNLNPPPRNFITRDKLHSDLFWCDAEYKNIQHRSKPIGGLLGLLHLTQIAPYPKPLLRLLILGQYLGIGQRRTFGLGRYRLETDRGLISYQRIPSPNSHIKRILEKDNLVQAWEAIRENQRQREKIPADQEDIHTPDLERLKRIGKKITSGQYQPPALNGYIHNDSDGGLRPLAVAPFIDRVLQRATAQILTPSFEKFMDHSSFGYRRGLSRFNARDKILQLNEQGYQWVFEADIEGFFDHVLWPRLTTRLKALLGDDPIVPLILSWITAPIDYKGEQIQRRQGLPQGSPLSPLLANLILDDFDSDLRDAGLKSVRFADDFVILTKTKEEAEQALNSAQVALDDLALNLKSEKTRITSFQQGFRFLGFLFVNGTAIEVRPEGVDDNPKAPKSSWLAAYEQIKSEKEEVDSEEKLEQQLRSHHPVPLLPFSEHPGSLIVTGHSALLLTSNDQLIVERHKKVIHSVPWNHLKTIILFGNHQITTPAIKAALSHHTQIHFASFTVLFIIIRSGIFTFIFIWL